MCMHDVSQLLPGEKLLDNPIWNSLLTIHAPIALGAHTGSGLARCYPQNVGPLAGVADPGDDAYRDLASVVAPGDIAVLFLERPCTPPPGWQILREGPLVQMLCRRPPEAVPLRDAEIISLGEPDFAEMTALATLTEPGPFRSGTGSLGGFLGIRVEDQDGRLVAMAGRRLAPTGFVEISAVCTHPDFRGRGFARSLVSAVAGRIWAEGLTPFLTSFAGNTGAIRVYEQVGFRYRRSFELAAIKPPAPAAGVRF